MARLVDSFQSGAHSLSVFEQGLQVVSNNTTNATTPGYADQTPVFSADSFSVAGGQPGGVSLGGVQNSRDPYAELNVQAAQNAENYSATVASNLVPIEGAFPLATASTSGGGVGGALNRFFASISNLTTNPNNGANRQVMLDAAGSLATSFNDAYNTLDSARINAVNEGQDAVGAINALVSQIQQINIAKRDNPSGRSDPGLDAQLYAHLEDLSKLVSFTTSENSDGTTNIFIGGQDALLLGITQNKLTAGTVGVPSATAQFQVLDANGRDVTSLATVGKLGALINVVNQMIPSYITKLNTLASSVADAVNSTLTSGIDQNNNPGVALFTYSSTAPAHTLSTTGIQTTQLAAALSTNPGGNDNAVNLSNLTSATQTALGGTTFTTYYGNFAASIGTDSSIAQSSQTTQEQVLSQAQTLRSNLSGVSLDTEAARLTEYQQAYGSTGRMLTVVNQMMQTVLNLIPMNG
jgi:flagellar hook-associated protein 1 FlgK